MNRQVRRASLRNVDQLEAHGGVFHLLLMKEMADFELAAALPDDHAGSVSKRRGDMIREGTVRDSGLRRITPYGSRAIVWEIIR